MGKFKVSVIIINFNSSHYTIACITSIKQMVSDALNYNIIVVDNNSKNQDYDILQSFTETQGNVLLVRSKQNVGFSGGNMLGVQYANADYLFFLNNDTVLLNDCLSILYNFMESKKDVGICTGQMYNTDRSFHHSFGYFPTLALKVLGTGVLRPFCPRAFPSKKTAYAEPLKVDLVTGAAMFVDYAKFAEVGGFDTNYFLFCEEEDIAQKMRRANYSVYVVPEARFVHHMGKSTTRNLDIEKESYISLLYYHRKYNSWLSFMILKGLYSFKNFKKFYKHPNYLKLAIFVLCGASMKHSLRHRQALRIETD